MTWAHVSEQVGEQIWAQVGDQIWAQVGDDVWTQIKDHDWARVQGHAWDQVMDEVNDQVTAQVRNQLGSKFWDLFMGEIEDQLGDQIGDQAWVETCSEICKHVSEQFGDQIKDQVKKDLQKFKFASAYREGSLNETLTHAIDFTFLVYQLGSFPMKHSDEFKKIQNDFAELISEKINQEQIQTVLYGLCEILRNQSHESYLVRNQLKMILRYLPSES